jgi:hypothetical protein
MVQYPWPSAIFAISCSNLDTMPAEQPAALGSSTKCRVCRDPRAIGLFRRTTLVRIANPRHGRLAVQCH